MASPCDISGIKFGRLLVESLERRDSKHSYWKCVCDCGIEKITTMNALKRGLITSCGCFRKELSKSKATTHGKTGTSEYGIWSAMKRRCTNKNTTEWENYGGRGITFCERWSKFENFILDMGNKPKGLTLERRDTNGNYEPQNCYWATRIEQANNTRGNNIVIVDGVNMTFTEACKHYGVPVSTAATRMSRGFPSNEWFLPKKR